MSNFLDSDKNRISGCFKMSNPWTPYKKAIQCEYINTELLINYYSPRLITIIRRGYNLSIQ